MPALKVNCDDDGPADVHGLEHANRLIQLIFLQITEGDAPSVNFGRHDAIHRRLGSNHGGYSRPGGGGGGPLFLAERTKSSFSNRSVVSESDCNDSTSIMPSELSVSSYVGGLPLPFPSPKPSSRFPPLPPSSSSHKRDLNDASNHSVGDRLSLSTHSLASPSYGIGASLMGTLALADLCYRTVGSDSEKEGDQREKKYLKNRFSPGMFSPPPSSPLESEDSSPPHVEPNTSCGIVEANIRFGKFEGKINHRHKLSSAKDPTPRIHNGGKDTQSFRMSAECDGQGFFPHRNEMDTENNDPWEGLTTDTSWNTESGSFSFDGAITEEGEKIGIGYQASPVDNESVSPLSPPFWRPALSGSAGETAGNNRSHSPLNVQRHSSTDPLGRNSGPTSRVIMFGSEYARILSSSKPPSPTPAGIPHLLSSAIKAKRSTSAVSNKIRASLSSSLTVAQSHGSSAKESVESGGSVLLSLDDCANSVATAAITDVIVTTGPDVPPRGYYRAFQLGEESTKNVVPGRKCQRLFFNVKKEPNWDRAVQRPCVTAFCVIYPDRNEFVPPGYSVVRHYQTSGSSEGGGEKKDGSPNKGKHQLGLSASPAANINLSSSGERVYICYRRSREGNPVTGIMCLRPTKGDLIPEGYTVLERTPRNYLADMAAKSEQPLFLAYRQRLENLECLRPMPLVLSVLQCMGRKELKAYYCTGGSVVPCDVGKYHIMDRSTHSLLSSSSAQSRLNLIQSSRNESETAMPAWVSSASNHSSSSRISVSRNSQNSASTFESSIQKDDSSESSQMHRHTTESFDSCVSRTTSQSSLASYATSLTCQQSHTLTKSTLLGWSSLFGQSDDTLQTCLDAMHFIPPVESAKTVFQHDDAMHSDSLLQSRVAVITPILTSCYTSQGGAALMAVEGLISMLNDTNFFAQDVADENGNHDGVVESRRLTILDLSVQVVCDVATSSARETYFRSCVDFVSDAMRYASGNLNDRTIGFVLRFYLFVFYFGVSVPTGNGWPFNKELNKSKNGILDDFLLSDSLEQNTGGAPQAAAIALKEFVSIILSRIATGLEKAHWQLFKALNEDELKPQEYAHTILSRLVENAMNRVDAANYTQLALYQIHRSGGSELFWHDMTTSIGEGLFRKDVSENQDIIHSNIISFAILASFVKISSAKVRMVINGTEPVPRDVASKLLSFELLLHFVKMWHVAVIAKDTMYLTEEANLKSVTTQNHDGMEFNVTMTYVVRRLVVPSLLSNTSAAIEDCRVYRRILRIISQLWCNPYYRHHMKIDLAVLIDHFVLNLLCLGPQVNSMNNAAENAGANRNSVDDMPSLLQQQLDTLEEMKIWFSSTPKDALELYTNYDIHGDMLPAAYCKLLYKICEALSTLAEQCGTIISEHGRFTRINGANGSPRRTVIFTRENDMSKACVREAAQCMRENSFGAITAIAKSMMDCAILSQKQQEERLPAADMACLYVEDKSPTFDNDTTLGLSPQMSPVPSFGDENIVDYWKTSIEKRKAPLQPIWPTPSQEIETPLLLRIKRCVTDDSSKQVQFQHKQESFDVAFELISTKGLKNGIDYLIACHLLTPSPRHISAFLRIHQLCIDPGVLGEYLGEGGIGGDDKDFWNLIRFNFARAISFVGMNIEQALRHFLTNCGFRLPGEAQKIDRIISTFSQCYWEDNAGDIPRCPFQDQDTVFLVSFAIIMLNTDLHKSHVATGKGQKRMTKNEFIKNLRGVYDGVDQFREYIYSIYDSIESTPIAISNFSPQKQRSKQTQGSSSLLFKDQADLSVSIQSWVKGVKSAQELLRTVAVRHDKFESSGGQHKDEMSLKDLTFQMFSANWHHIHGAINAAIDHAHLDLAGLDCCIDVLEYSLCAASYLGMTVELSAFSQLLGRVNRFNDMKVMKGVTKEEKSSKESSIGAEPGGPMNFEDVEQVRSLTRLLHESLHVDNEQIEKMKLVANKIRNGNILLNDPSRIFVREGDLIKRHHLAGRCSTYRFFLFSDVLVYAHKSRQGGDYKVHEELPLHLMKIEDNGSPSSSTKQNSFYIHHPNKSFFVVASSISEKHQWIDDINNSIQREVKRKAKIEKSRIEAARRAKI